MTDVIVDVTGEMETPKMEASSSLTSLLQFPPRVGQAREWLTQRRQHIRPWLVFVQTNNFRVAGSVPRLSRRLMRNVEYFQSNYLLVFLGLVAYCLVTSPLLMLAVGGSLYAGHRLSQRSLQGKRAVLWGHELSLVQQYGCVAACSLPVYWLAGAGAAMFWVLGASFFLIVLHAAFYNIDALLAEPDEQFQQV